jgi:hypothetical protein
MCDDDTELRLPRRKPGEQLHPLLIPPPQFGRKPAQPAAVTTPDNDLVLLARVLTGLHRIKCDAPKPAPLPLAGVDLIDYGVLSRIDHGAVTRTVAGVGGHYYDDREQFPTCQTAILYFDGLMYAKWILIHPHPADPLLEIVTLAPAGRARLGELARRQRRALADH